MIRHDKELGILHDFIRSKKLRHTPQRELVAKVFLNTERHVSVEDLHALVRKFDPSVGYTTVYRTMKILEKSGLCIETDLGDGFCRFEHAYNHSHHDHLICTKCGSFIEVCDSRIEMLQEKMAKKHEFIPLRHKLEIFGVCKECVEKKKKG